LGRRRVVGGRKGEGLCRCGTKGHSGWREWGGKVELDLKRPDSEEGIRKKRNFDFGIKDLNGEG